MDISKNGLRDTSPNKAGTGETGHGCTVRRLSTLYELQKLGPVWNDRAAEGDYPTIFQTFEWITAWWAAFGEGRSLYVLVVEYGARVIGIAPLMLTERRRLGRKKRVIRFIGTPQADYGDFIGSDKKLIAQMTFGFLKDHANEWDEINLTEISERSGDLPILRELLASGSSPHFIRESETCFHFVYEGDDSERENFSPKKSQRLRRSINWFNRQGPLELQEIRDPKEIAWLLPGYFHTHIVRWHHTFRPSMFLEEEHRDFYRTLVDKLAPLGRISFFVLRFKGQPIAYEFNFLYRNRSGHYSITHDKLYHDRSVGRILNHRIRGKYIKDGLEELDFSRGAHDYKDSLSNRSHVNYKVRIFSSRWSLALVRLYEALKNTGPVRRLVASKSFTFKREQFAWQRQTYGLRGLAKVWLSRLAKRIVDYRSLRVFGCPEIAGPVEPDVEVEFARMEKTDSNKVASFLGVEAESKGYQALEQRLSDEDGCFAVLCHGTILCLGWATRNAHTDPATGFVIEPKPGQVLLSDLFTSPAARGLGLGSWLIARQIEYYRAQGLYCIAVSSTPIKEPSTIMDKAGCRLIASFGQLRLLGRPLSTPGTVHVSFP